MTITPAARREHLRQYSRGDRNGKTVSGLLPRLTVVAYNLEFVGESLKTKHLARSQAALTIDEQIIV